MALDDIDKPSKPKIEDLRMKYYISGPDDNNIRLYLNYNIF